MKFSYYSKHKKAAPVSSSGKKPAQPDRCETMQQVLEYLFETDRLDVFESLSFELTFFDLLRFVGSHESLPLLSPPESIGLPSLTEH